MSNITVLNAPPDTLLTSLPTLKAFLGLQSDASQDDVLILMLAAASDFIQNYCGRQFAKQKVTELVAATGVPDLLLSITPIISIEAVSYDGGAYTDYTIPDKEAGIVQSKIGFRTSNIETFYLNASPSNYAELLWSFTYTGGYVLPSWTTMDDDFYTGGGPTPKFVRNLPYDLERACIETARSFYKQLGTGADPAMTYYKIGETLARWDWSLLTKATNGDMAAMGIPPNVLGILQHYRRPF